MYQDDFNQLEARWMDLVDQTGVASTCQYSFPGSDPPPHKAFIATYHGFQTCFHAGQTLSVQNHGFRIQYHDPGCPYDIYLDGNPEVTCIFVDFGLNGWAKPVTNAERYGISDNMAEDFAGLQYLTSGGWTDFDAYKACDTVIDYNLQIDSATEVESVYNFDGSAYCNL